VFIFNLFSICILLEIASVIRARVRVHLVESSFPYKEREECTSTFESVFCSLWVEEASLGEEVDDDIDVKPSCSEIVVSVWRWNARRRQEGQEEEEDEAKEKCVRRRRVCVCVITRVCVCMTTRLCVCMCFCEL